MTRGFGLQAFVIRPSSFSPIMSSDLQPANWPRTSLLSFVYFLVSGACLGSHYVEHGFRIDRWMIDVACAGIVLGICFATALAIRSLRLAAGAMLGCLVGTMILFVFRTEVLAGFVMGPGIPLAFLSFGCGRLFRRQATGRWQFSLRSVLLLPALVAGFSWLVWLRAIPTIMAMGVTVSSIAAADAGYRLIVGSSSARGANWRDALMLTLGCLYLPFSWLLLIDYPWSTYHWQWLAMWPVLPGALVAFLVHAGPMGLAVAGATTLGMIVVVAWIVRQGRWLTIATAFAALALAGFTALIAQSLFRA